MDKGTERVTCAWCELPGGGQPHPGSEDNLTGRPSCFPGTWGYPELINYHQLLPLRSFCHRKALPVCSTSLFFSHWVFLREWWLHSDPPAREALYLRTLLHAAACSPFSVCVTLPRGLISQYGEFNWMFQCASLEPLREQCCNPALNLA